MKSTLLIPFRREWVDQILILDGQSTDGTAEFARAEGCEVYVQKERGIRQRYKEVWPLIRSDVVVTFSPDGNSVVDRLPPPIETMKQGYDLVIVSRRVRSSSSWVRRTGREWPAT